MRDSVPSTRYSSVCNVLRQWNILLIPTYRVYRLYDNDSKNSNNESNDKNNNASGIYLQKNI